MSDTYKKKDTAERYDFARALPEETGALWMNTLWSQLPIDSFKRILDLGGGTGRFSELLQKTYGCPVITIDPSEEMLNKGRNRGLDNISWICGSAENNTLETGSINLVWMSQVFHHLENPISAFREIYRVLCTRGYLVVRNGTQENDAEIEWMKLFPEAMQIEKQRIPRQADIINTICPYGFRTISVQTVYQRFAKSYTEYYEKISRRGLSVLITISDEAFNTGLARLHEWALKQPPDKPAYEPVDMFVFQKRQMALKDNGRNS